MTNINNPYNKSWVSVPQGSDFPIQNLPFGIFNNEVHAACPGVAIGDRILIIKEIHKAGLLNELPFTFSDVSSCVLNDMMQHGKKWMTALRNRIGELLLEENAELRDRSDRDSFFGDRQTATLHLPIRIGDYTDFYSSIEHATNVGSMFRPENPLLPNWKHLPVGYHGRASSIVVSGTEIRRPKGQTRPDENQPPVFGPTKQLDFELEMAFVTFDGVPLGRSIAVEEAHHHIFGMVLFNDWSARDIQKWEYVPLGPFLSKNFASSMAPWIVTLDALEPFRVKGPVQDPEPLPYLKSSQPMNYDIHLEVVLQPSTGTENVICRSNTKYLYWNMSQQLAHHTVNGCNIRCGDVMASGTISGPDAGSYGSMLELAWRGTKPIVLSNGESRSFIQDGDTLTLRGFAGTGAVKIGFGEVQGTIKPSE